MKNNILLIGISVCTTQKFYKGSWKIVKLQIELIFGLYAIEGRR
jgi:hypothetical protein